MQLPWPTARAREHAVLAVVSKAVKLHVAAHFAFKRAQSTPSQPLGIPKAYKCSWLLYSMGGDYLQARKRCALLELKQNSPQTTAITRCPPLPAAWPPPHQKLLATPPAPPLKTSRASRRLLGKDNAAPANAVQPALRARERPAAVARKRGAPAAAAVPAVRADGGAIGAAAASQQAPLGVRIAADDCRGCRGETVSALSSSNYANACRQHAGSRCTQRCKRMHAGSLQAASAQRSRGEHARSSCSLLNDGCSSR